MGTKLNPGKYDCYAKALPDEPIFTLMARDLYAPTMLEDWAARREGLIDVGSYPQSDRPVVAEARQCAKKMREWRLANDGKWRS